MAGEGLKADTVIRSANVITMDPSQPRAEAVAIREGKIAAVGDDGEVEALIGPGTLVLNMEGKTVVPGFIDAHIHVLSSGIRHVMAVDCALTSVEAIQSALRKLAGNTKEGEWVEGFKFDDTKTRENRFLTRQDLDEVSTQHSIMVAHRAGHVYYLNGLAMEMAGFNDETPDPAGGRFGRDEATGKLNGVVYERAIEPVRDGLVPRVTPEIRRQGLRRICQMLTSAGLTSVHDAKVSNDELETYQEGRKNGDLSLKPIC